MLLHRFSTPHASKAASRSAVAPGVASASAAAAAAVAAAATPRRAAAVAPAPAAAAARPAGLTRRSTVMAPTALGEAAVALSADATAAAAARCVACGAAGGGAAAGLTVEQQKQRISDAIRGIPDFPKPGILFWDVTTLMLDPAAFQLTVDLLAARYRGQRVDVVAGFEARGLIFGAPLALALGAAFVPLRKPGKLPGATVSEGYATEYSTDRIEMHTGAVQPGQRVVLVDDLVATGGTLRAGVSLVERVGAEVVEAACVIELPALGGRAKLGGTPLFVLIEKEGE